MNIIKQPEGDKQSKDAITRRWFLGGLVAVAVTGALVAGHDKENNMKIYDLSTLYSHHKPNFESFFFSANQNRSAPWSRDNGGGKYLIVDTGKEGEYYVVSLFGDQLKIALSSYNDEFLCRYTLGTSMLEVKGNLSITDTDQHLGKVESLIKKQYPNF